MLRRRPLIALLAAAVLMALSMPPALAQVDGESETPGGSCPPGAVTGHAGQPSWDTFFECNSSNQWQRGPGNDEGQRPESALNLCPGCGGHMEPIGPVPRSWPAKWQDTS